MTTVDHSLRFGLVGTGHWAQLTHAPALATTDGIEFTSVWGRDSAAAAALAAPYEARAHVDFGDFLAEVDAVAFAVPPDVQASLALTAAAAGKHLLLEKPVATSAAEADKLAQAVRDAHVSSVVFFTSRFQPEVRTWLASLGDRSQWAAGSAVWLGTALQPGNPFNSSWRHDKGGLWDLAPHAVSLLSASLGPVTSVTADSGEGDLTYLVLHHEGGATSTVTVTLQAPDAAECFMLSLWGEQGWTSAPTTMDPVEALSVALTELAGCVQDGRAHPCDAAFGRDVVHILADAQAQLDAR